MSQTAAAWTFLFPVDLPLTSLFNTLFFFLLDIVTLVIAIICSPSFYQTQGKVNGRA